MHTSTRLVAQDFSPPIAAICPDYHELDRIGVVSLGLEEGVFHTSYALLAFTTAFYDRLRARQSAFFDYPQHFAFVGVEQAAIPTIHVGSDLLAADTPQLWNAWSWLDVWPANKWLTAPPTVEGMIQSVFDYQINRLFWPRALAPQRQRVDHKGENGEMMRERGGQGTQPPDYLWKMLRTSLKAVYLYGPEATAASSPWAGLEGERIELHARAAAQEIVQESLVQLPAPLLVAGALDNAAIASTPQCYTRVPVEGFLGVVGGEAARQGR